MNLSPFFRQPVVWLGVIGLILLEVLAFWYVRRPTDANGNSLILSNRDKRPIRRDLSQQAAQRRQDSLRAVQADTAAAARYREGQQSENAALRLHQRERQAATTLDSRTLIPAAKASHGEALQAYLNDPRKLLMWRTRVLDMQRILDQLPELEAAVPGLSGRLDHRRIAVAGHSFGAQTAGLLLGARVLGADDSNPSEDWFDPRIKAGVLLSAAGRGGADLSPFAAEHFPHLNQSYAELRTPTLVVAGDADRSPLTRRGPDWFTDAYTLSPGATCLFTLFGAEHMLGGISGYLVTETTDEHPARVAAVQQLTWAYLRSALSCRNEVCGAGYYLKLAVGR